MTSTSWDLTSALSFRSSCKLLAWTVRAEFELRVKLGPELEKVWTTGRA
jgi:hypothetical protein